MSEQDYTKLQDVVTGIKDDITKMSADITAIRTAITGDDMGNSGLAGRVQKLEINQMKMHDRLAELDAKRRKLVAYIVGASGGLSGAINYFF